MHIILMHIVKLIKNSPIKMDYLKKLIFLKVLKYLNFFLFKIIFKNYI